MLSGGRLRHHCHSRAGALEHGGRDGPGQQPVHRGHRVATHHDHVPSTVTRAERLVGEPVPQREGGEHIRVGLGETRGRCRQGGAQVLEVGLDGGSAARLLVLRDGDGGVPEGVEHGQGKVAQGGLSVGELEDRQRLPRAVGPDDDAEPLVALGLRPADDDGAARVRAHRGAHRPQEQARHGAAPSRSQDQQVCSVRGLQQDLPRVAGLDHREDGEVAVQRLCDDDGVGHGPCRRLAHGDECETTAFQDGLVRCPAERARGVLGPVDADHDGTREVAGGR
ncbi:hypothetical protein NOCA1190118 [metagenome]|uniref:Uncharacterized protein n=1 Tax=metagenome TaxID=256318 RepID=A0A2P2CCW9_9ZZZZ